MVNNIKECLQWEACIGSIPVHSLHNKTLGGDMLQYNVQNITGNNFYYSKTDLDINELYDLLCLGFYCSSCSVVYELSPDVKVRRGQFHYEYNYPYGYEYMDKLSKNTYLITKVDDITEVNVKNIVKLLDDYIHVRPVFQCKNLDIKSFSQLANYICRDFSISDNIVNLLLNNIISLDIRNISVHSKIILRETNTEYNMYLFIDLIKRIYYAIRSDIKL